MKGEALPYRNENDIQYRYWGEVVKTYVLTVAMGLLVTACGAPEPSALLEDEETNQVGALVTGTCTAEHTTHTEVFSTAAERVYYDMDAMTVTTVDDPGWDISIETWVFESNGGVTGNGGVTIAGVEDAYDAFDDACVAPAEGFAEDTFAGEGMGTWFNYSMATHEVSVADWIYFIRTTEGAVHRLKVDGYYEADGEVHTPGITHGVVDPS